QEHQFGLVIGLLRLPSAKYVTVGCCWCDCRTHYLKITMAFTLTRTELYDRVWAEPVDTLAKEFGLSNVGLGKACRRHDIPVPPRGYWARKAVGQKLWRP